MALSSWFCLFVICTAMIVMTKCAPMTHLDMVNYLHNYGFTGSKKLDEINNDEMKTILEEFQDFYALPVTGKMDNATREMMEKPRCGRPDKGLLQNEYAANIARDFKWDKKHLTYQLKNYPKNNYGMKTVTKETERAFNMWSDVANITFEEIFEGRADIDIYFPEISEGDGKGKTLAYAYYPKRGDIYFDAEDWILMGHEGIIYFQVATHEIGHSLGLQHQPTIFEAVMAPFYHGYLPDFMLHQNDIKRIQDKYGPNLMLETGNSFCRAEKLDAVFSRNSWTNYILKNNYVWKYVGNALEKDYPKRLQEEWPGLPMNVDSAFYYDNQFYFFKDLNGYVFNGSMRDFTFPDNIPQAINAIVVVKNIIYTFIDDKYWKFYTNPIRLLEGFPRQISDFWKGVPDSVDAAYYDQYRTITFFKNRKIYRFNTETKVARGHDISNWFPCKSLNP